MSNDLSVEYPLRVSAAGATALARSPQAIAEQRIEQLLFTNPGERLNRPRLGCGLIELIFGAASAELLAATQFQVASSLQQWLGDSVRVLAVDVAGRGGTLAVTVTYQLPGDGAALTMTRSTGVPETRSLL